MNGVEVARKLRYLSWGIGAVALAALVVWRMDLWDPTGSTVGDGSAQTAAGTDVGLRMFPPGERSSVPVLEGQTLDGTQFSLAELAGNVVVINVWGSWCGPCRAETPDLVRVASENAGRGVRFVGIDTRDNLAAAKAFVAKYDVPYPSVFDQDGRALQPFQPFIPSAAVPSTIVVDRDGNIAARVIGPVTYSTLSGLLDDVVGSPR